MNWISNGAQTPCTTLVAVVLSDAFQPSHVPDMQMASTVDARQPSDGTTHPCATNAWHTMVAAAGSAEAPASFVSTLPHGSAHSPAPPTRIRVQSLSLLHVRYWPAIA